MLGARIALAASNGAVRTALASHREMFAAGCAAAVSLALTMTGLALLPQPFGPAHIAFLGGSAALVVALASRLLRSRSAVQPAGDDEEVARLRQRLERRIEQLEDLQWELREKEARYRDLLDSQGEVILRRDLEGRLTFVNRAFCRAFGVGAGEVVGTRYEPVVLEAEAPQALSSGHRRALEKVQTAAGPRWFCFEETTARLPGSGEELQRVGRDVTEQREAEEALASARAQAESANRAKSRFLANMSHEIRTPMNGILGMAGLLLSTEQTPEQTTYTRAIEQSARTLLELIDEILDLSKIEAGKIELDHAPIDLEQCLQNAVELLAPKAHEKGLEIAWTVAPGVPDQLLGDEARLRQILLNLIGNAVKFTQRGGVCVRAVVPAGQPGASVVIEVEDTGPGIPPSALPSLFTEFEQAGNASRDPQAGTGLGLAISRRLARAMGGDIAVDSTLGSGSTFRLVLGLPEAGGSTSPRTVDHAHCRFRRAVLAVDLPLERRALAGMLAEAGLDVVEAHSLADARERARVLGGGVPQVLFVNASADPAAGARLLQEMHQGAPRAPVSGVVLITAQERASVPGFKQHGFDSYLVRPVRRKSLFALLTGQLQRSDASSVPAPRHEAEPVRNEERPSGCRILLAEDNSVNALLASTLIKKAGCVCVLARNGLEAIEAVRRTLDGAEPPFDLILMDVHMPGCDGLTATRRIRAMAEGGRRCPPIVALTASAFLEDRQRCFAAGMQDYLAKPFSWADFQTLLGRWLPLQFPSGRSSAA